MKFSIVIRADASLQIGGGHIMRTLALAEELRRKEIDVRYVCRDLRGNLCSIIEQAGFPVHLLPALPQQYFPAASEPTHAKWLETSWEIDAQQTAYAIKSSVQKADWLIVDHYSLAAPWETALRTHAKRIMVIDDLADRPHNCDLLLDQTFTENASARYERLIEKTPLLLGPKFALLRREFYQRRKTLSARSGALKTILIFFGTVDASNQTIKAIEAIRLLRASDLSVHVVVGTTNPHREKIRAECEDMPNVHFQSPAENLVELMATADLAIGAAGTTSWERCCLGLPAIVVQLAENQKLICEKLGVAGAILFQGAKENVSAENLAGTIEELRHQPEKLRAISQRAWEITDGWGAQRVACWLGPLRLSRATLDDAKILWEWANDPSVRQNAFQTEPIPWTAHLGWMEKKLRSFDTFIWIARDEEKCIGQMRIDVSGNSASADVSVSSSHRASGRGPELFIKGLREFWKERPDIKVVAQIKKENQASQKMLKLAGFRTVLSTREDSVQFESNANEFCS
ncbi:MAG: UDP-2,4-diacetamido-2,4,6-trideoxy-beta-L-altropyranose hydrolase [Verrucomicrobiota bacterium]